MNSVLKTILILFSGIFLGFGLGATYSHASSVNTFLILIISLILGGFLLGSALFRKPSLKNHESKKENSNDNSEPRV